MRFLRPWPDLRPGVETFFLGRRRPLRTSWLMLGMRRVMLAAARSGSRWAGPRRAAERARASPRPARPADHRLALRGPRPPPRRLRRAARPHPRHRPHLARLEADASPPPAPLRRAGRRPAGLRPLAAAPRGHGADAGGARRRGRAGDGRSGLRSGPRGRQLARWLDRARARPPRSRADGYGDLPRGPPAQAREGVGKEHAACDALGRPEPPGTRRARRNPSRHSPLRRPGCRPAVAPRPGRLLGSASPVRGLARLPGHAPTHVRGAAEGPRRDRRAGSGRVGHARPAAAPSPGKALRAPDPERGAALPEGSRPHADVRRPGAARRAGGYDVARAARSGAGVRAAATITSTKAKLCRTIPTGSLGMGSPNTRMPPLIAVTFAAALVRVMTGTASPFWSPRAEA